MATVQPAEFKPDTAYMEVPRCDSCKHWRHVLRGLGVCEKLNTVNDAVVVTGGAYAQLQTRGHFGCVQFEAACS